MADITWLDNPVPSEGLKVAGVRDIAALQVVVIAQRGTKKDFFDLYRILQDHEPASLSQSESQKW